VKVDLKISLSVAKNRSLSLHWLKGQKRDINETGYLWMFMENKSGKNEERERERESE
jgi:hypothetical protein